MEESDERLTGKRSERNCSEEILKEQGDIDIEIARKRELMTAALANAGKGLDATRDPIVAENERKFMDTKKSTYGDYDPVIQ